MERGQVGQSHVICGALRGKDGGGEGPSPPKLNKIKT